MKFIFATCFKWVRQLQIVLIIRPLILLKNGPLLSEYIVNWRPNLKLVRCVSVNILQGILESLLLF